MSLANEIDDRTVEEQLRDLGVVVERKNEVAGVKWVFPRYITKKSLLISVTKKGVYLPANVDGLKGKILLGTGTYRGNKVLLIKTDPKGYQLTIPTKGRRPHISNKTVINQLMAAGLKPGYYELIKIKGGYMGVPAE